MCQCFRVFRTKCTLSTKGDKKFTKSTVLIVVGRTNLQTSATSCLGDCSYFRLCRFTEGKVRSCWLQRYRQWKKLKTFWVRPGRGRLNFSTSKSYKWDIPTLVLLCVICVVLKYLVINSSVKQFSSVLTNPTLSCVTTTLLKFYIAGFTQLLLLEPGKYRGMD